MKNLILLSCLLLAGCFEPMTPQQKTQARWQGQLPPGFTEVTELNGHWITFRWEGKKYLYRSSGGSSVMVELRDE